MRIALITIVGDASGSGVPILGKSIARRQLEFALAAGCDAAIALGDGGGEEAIALRHQAEAGGMKFRTMGTTHNLLGAVGTGDELLVIAPRLIPANADALRIVGESRSILVVPADPGISLGFERIDSARAWGGAMLIPGRLVEGLAQLPRDCDAAPALLRIALQAQLPSRQLAPAALTDGSWIVLRGPERPAVEALLLDRALPRPPRSHFSVWLAGAVMRRFAPRLLGQRFAGPALKAGIVALALAAGMAGAYGLPALSLALVALVALAAEAAIAFDRMGAPALIAGGGKPALFGNWGRWLADALLVLCIALAIGGEWHHRLFPPLALLAALHAARPGGRRDLAAILGDRAVLAAAFAAAALAGFTEQAAMLATLAILAFWAVAARKDGG